MHPLHNLAIVSYDPKLIGNTPVKSAKLLDRKIAPGEDIWVVGMGADSELNVRATQVANLTPIQLPLELKIGDKVEIQAAGAYTSSYASVGFNGFAPLKTYCI